MRTYSDQLETVIYERYSTFKLYKIKQNVTETIKTVMK